MKTNRRLSSLVALLALAAFALAGCAAQDIAAVTGAGASVGAKAGGGALGGLFRKSPDKLPPEERSQYVQGQVMLTYTGATLDQVSKIIDDVLRANEQTLRITETRLLTTIKEVALGGADGAAHETYAIILVDIHPAWKDHIAMIARSGNERIQSDSGDVARRLKVLIDSALKERRIALVQ